MIAPAFSSAFGKEVDTPPSIAQGGNGVVTPGFPACQKRLFTMANFMDHLADDAGTFVVDHSPFSNQQ